MGGQAGALEEWLVGGLASPAYGVPLKLAQSWVDGDQILPLLDGLDEVAAEQRAACVEHQRVSGAATQRLARIVVCCRRAAYRRCHGWSFAARSAFNR